MHDVSVPAAVLAGLISFLSPCVLPLVPPYLVYLTGATIEHVLAVETILVLHRQTTDSQVRGGGGSVGARFKRIIREVALAYSKVNRRRKADAILSFLRKENVRDVLLVGATGHEHDGEHLMSHEGIVERRIADGYEIKMGINIVPSQITEHPFMILHSGFSAASHPYLPRKALVKGTMAKSPTIR